MLNRVYFILSLSFALWAIGLAVARYAPDKESFAFWISISTIGTYSFAALFLNFALVLTRNSLGQKFWSYLILYLPPLFFIQQNWVIGIESQRPYWTTFGWALNALMVSNYYLWFTVYYFVYTLVGFVFIIRWGVRSKSWREKQQAKTLMWGLLALCIGIMLDQIRVHYFMPNILYIVHFTTIFWTFTMGYAIVKNGLLTLTPEVAVGEIVARVKDLLIFTDPMGEIISINKRVTDLLSFEETELKGSLIEKLVDEKEIVREELARLSKTEPTNGKSLGKFSFSVSKQMKQKSSKEFGLSLPSEEKVLNLNYLSKLGHKLPVSVSLSAIKDPKGLHLGIVLIAQDMRQTRQLEDEIIDREILTQSLLEANEKLKELDIMKTDFLSTVSHELRTPLTSILGFTRIVRKRFEEVILPRLQNEDKKLERAVSQVRQNVDIIVAESERLTDLINDVLDIAKMEAGKIEWNFEVSSCDEIVERSIFAVASLFENKGLTLKKEITANLPQVYCDRDRIIQVVINLLSNAIKFTPLGEITVSVGQVADEIIISIQDLGIGIAPQDQDKVFDKFKQIGNTLTDKPNGTGLGLPICSQIVEGHGGRIWVVSQLDQGSTFSFALPLSQKRDIVSIEQV